jgi:hypothetical protein
MIKTPGKVTPGVSFEFRVPVSGSVEISFVNNSKLRLSSQDCFQLLAQLFDDQFPNLRDLSIGQCAIGLISNWYARPFSRRQSAAFKTSNTCA